MLHEIEVPQFGMVQIGEAAFDQPADKVQRQRRPTVAAEQPPGIGPTGLGRKGGAMHQIASVAGQCDSVASLILGRSRLHVLPREPAHANHPLIPAEDEDQAHLQ